MILQFTRGTNSRYVCWNSSGGSNVVTVPVGANVPVTIVNYDGTSVTTDSSGADGYSCTESDGPQYIEPAIQKTATTTTLSTMPSGSAPAGQPVTLTATVSFDTTGGTPTGNVQFSVGSTALGTAQLVGGKSATLTTTALPVGGNTLTATYSGDSEYLGSSGTAELTTTQVTAAMVKLTSSPSGTVAAGRPVTLTATVAGTGGTPTGNVQFSFGNSSFATSQLDSNGVATATISTLPIGADTITAKYQGDNQFSPASATVQLTITTAASSLIPWTPGPVPTGLGVVDLNLQEEPEAFQMMYAAGIRYIRCDLYWPTVEASKGVYDFSLYDPFVANILQAGMKPLFEFDYANPLYDGGYSPNDAAGDTAFANFAKAAVDHYKGKGIIWEIYNEPQNFWTASGGNPSPTNDASVVAPLYASLAIATGSTIKAAYPNEIVIGPAAGWFDSGSPAYWGNTQAFIEDVFQAGIGKYLDAVSVHPYRIVPETSTTDYDWLRGEIAGGIVTNLPIVASELGNTSSFYLDQGQAMAEQIKGQKLARSLLMSQVNSIPITILYDWMDNGNDPADPELNYGLVAHYATGYTTSPIVPLPAYNALQTFSSQLNGYTYAGRIGTDDPTDYILQFSNGTDSRYVCWNMNGTANVVNVPVPANSSVTVTGFDGTPIASTTAGANGYACTESAGPQYIVVSGSGSGGGGSEATPSFVVTSNSTTLYVSPGGSNTAQLIIIPTGVFSSAIALSCGTVPTYLTCTFSPSSVTPKGTQLIPVQLTVSVAATATATSLPANSGTTVLALIPLGLLTILPVSIGRRRWHRSAQLIILGICVCTALIGCGGGSSKKSQPSSSGLYGTQKLTITASSGNNNQTVPITVVIAGPAQNN
jgi:hypothetical protein